MLDVAETFENEAYRIHRYASVIRVTEIRNACKRGKKCRDMALYDLDFKKKREAEIVLMIRGAIKLAKDYAPLEVMESYLATCSESYGVPMEVRDHRGVDTQGYDEKIEIVTAFVAIVATKTQYMIRDLVDTNNEPTMISRGGKIAARKVYDFLEANPNRVRSMKFRDLYKVIGDLGGNPHYYCAMD